MYANEKENMSRKACDTHLVQNKVFLVKALQRESVLKTHFVVCQMSKV